MIYNYLFKITPGIYASHQTAATFIKSVVVALEFLKFRTYSRCSTISLELSREQNGQETRKGANFYHTAALQRKQ